MPPALPIDGVRTRIGQAFAGSAAVVIESPPGSGKTTRVPWWEAQRVAPAQVWLVQPRRLAVRLAAERLAEASGAPLGQRVGYQVRHTKKGGPRTQLWVMTEGVFLRRVLRDPVLEGVGTVLLDEFHERSVQVDLALSLLREIRATVRPDLGLGVLSATLDPEPLERFLHPVARIRAEGRPHPVEIVHDDGGEEALEFRVSRAVRRVLADTEGDVLAFLPGTPEIRRCEARFRDRPIPEVQVHSLHGSLSLDAQRRAVRPDPEGRRKIVLATNVAESSLTIEGVKTVVDGGLEKRVEFDPGRGMDRLVTRRIAMDSATQRAGRAGRLGPGRAIRLWSPKERLEPTSPPEIARVDLAPVLGWVLRWSETDPHRFEWFEAPPAGRLEAAVELLRDLGISSPDGWRLTERGRSVLDLPLHPRFGVFVSVARDLGAGAPAVEAAALAQGRDVVRDRAAFARRTDVGDLWARRRVGFGDEDAGAELDRSAVAEARRTAEQLKRELGVDGRPEGDLDAVLQTALLAGFPDRLGRWDPSGRVALAAGGWAVLDRDSVVRPDAANPWLVAVELAGADAGRTPRIRSASEVSQSALATLPLRVETEVRFDSKEERVVAVESTRFRGMELSSRPVPWDGLDPAPALAQAARRNLDRALPWTPELERWVLRWRFVADHLPEAGLSPPPDDVRLELVDEAVLGATRFAELRNVDLVALLRARLGSAAARVDQGAPDAWPIPSGRRVRLRYVPEGPPVLSAPLQELFGLTETPRVAGGRVALRVEVLAPNRRPVQITQDLESFWRRTYREVRKDLRSRYPKHAWPEDPADGVPQIRPRRRR